jgi:uncharacterized protein YjbJ (UPF0337 family)
MPATPECMPYRGKTFRTRGTKIRVSSFDLRKTPEGVAQLRRTKMGSTSDKLAGKANEVSGKVKQAAGDMTDNPKLKAKGNAQEAKGHAQQAKGKVKDAAKDFVDRL